MLRSQHIYFLGLDTHTQAWRWSREVCAGGRNVQQQKKDKKRKNRARRATCNEGKRKHETVLQVFDVCALSLCRFLQGAHREDISDIRRTHPLSLFQPPTSLSSPLPPISHPTHTHIHTHSHTRTGENVTDKIKPTSTTTTQIFVEKLHSAKKSRYTRRPPPPQIHRVRTTSRNEIPVTLRRTPTTTRPPPREHHHHHNTHTLNQNTKTAKATTWNMIFVKKEANSSLCKVP